MSIENAKELKDNYQFHKALKLLENLDQESKNPNYYRLKAECYYQDLQLPMEERFKKATNLLKIDNDDNPKETLRLKGAVFKRKYYYSRNIRDLHYAIFYYEQSLEDVKECTSHDYAEGYSAANTVFLYCLLLDELDDSLSSDLKEIYKNKIKLIANNSITRLESFQKLGKWNYASLSSLYLIKNNFKKSKESMIKYKEFYKKGFEREQFITIEHIVKLFDVLPLKHKENKLLDILFPYDEAENIIKSIRIGKIGLALSGGGFRASLFHIGILKRLAELDILRHIELISTVSGGSIVGMYYYLELKKLLEENQNSSLGQKEYIKLVNRIETNFSKSIESNLRMLAFIKCPRTNLTKKLGKLYQKKLYNKISSKTPSLMNELAIKPKIDGFNKKEYLPDFENFKLKNNIPKIIINATLLNNGHNWQFTTEGMGENGYMSDMAVNNLEPYPFHAYTEDKPISIGDAIVASSAVPVLFDPISLSYNEKTIQLADGGLYDNMGLSSLVANECSHIIVSDGSGQLKENNHPSTFRLDVLGRITEVLMNRTRDGEYKMAKQLKALGVLTGLTIVHMEAKSSMDDELQKKLALVRTDLDAFHELESKGLVYAGYKLCSNAFQQERSNHDWGQFILEIEGSAEALAFEKEFENNREEVLKKLETSSKALMKVPILLFKNLWSSLPFTHNKGKVNLAPSNKPKYLKRILKKCLSFFMSIIMWIPSYLYLRSGNKIYKHIGKLNAKK